MRTRLSACSGLMAAVVTAGLAAGMPLFAQVPAPARRVLLIHGGPEAFPGGQEFDVAIRRSLHSHPTLAVEVYSEYLENEEFGDAAYDSLRALVRIKFRDRPLDLVIANTTPALQFVLRYREELFPAVPLVFAAATIPPAVLHGKVPGATGIVRESSHIETIDLALKIHPGTKRLHVVAHAPAVAGFRERVQATLAPFAKRVRVTYGDEATLPEMRATLKALPADSLIFFVRYSPVTIGRIVFSDEMLPEVVQAAPVPVYCSLETFMGKGVVGGMLRSQDVTGARLGEIARKVLGGAAPESIPIEATEIKAIFDWRELQRWRIDESRLPPGYEIRYRVPTVWEHYGSYIAATIFIVIAQLLLIVGLLYQHRARQRAEIESRKNLALAADAGRRQTMSALTNSLTHELGQPLSSMIHNTKALQLMLGTHRATPDAIGEILSDIQAQGIQATQIIDRHRTMLRSHEIDKKPIDLHAVIRESLTLVAHDLSSRGIDAVVDRSQDLCIICGDQVLLQQVLVNLVMNAMDAMAGTPPDKRRITIGTEVRAADVRVSVSDTGTGLPVELDRRLFTPFVTTKAHGLGIGLTIVRTIVDAHGGAIEARNNPTGGATFTVTLHRRDTPAILSASEATA